MHHHAGRLVDNGQIVVFVDDVERNLLRKGAQTRRVGCSGDRDFFPALQPQRCAGRAPADQHLAFGDQLLNSGATHLRQLRDQILIKALARLVRGGSESDRKRKH